MRGPDPVSYTHLAAIVVDGSHVHRASSAAGKLALAGAVERDSVVCADLFAGMAADVYKRQVLTRSLSVTIL